MMEFEKPTPRQQLEELTEVAKSIGLPSSIIFYPDGLVKSTIGFHSHLLQDSAIPNMQSEIKQKKVQPPMKVNQERHSRNLSGLSGWYKGTHYINGQPANTNGSRKNGNGRH